MGFGAGISVWGGFLLKIEEIGWGWGGLESQLDSSQT